MKKVLLLSLSLLLGFSAFAQQRAIKNDLREGVASAKKTVFGKDEPTTSAAVYGPRAQKSVVVNRWDGFEEEEVMITNYDLQSNQFVANRMYQLPNGSVAIAATWSHEPNQTASDRGTGYNFYNAEAEEWLDQPEERIEPWKTGWPSIAQFGENGEILLAHGNGHMQCFVRETAGEGDWTYVGALPDYPEGYAYTTEYPTWPRIVTCGDNHNIAVAAAVLQHSISSDETDLQTVMWRSEDPANIDSWTISYGPLHDLDTPWDHNQFSADDYCMAANGHTVAIMYSGCLTNSVWMFKSTDDGQNWTPTRVWENPYEGREFDEEPSWGMEDTLFMPMNGAIVIDKNGVVHVALNTFEMAHTLDNEPGYYSYWSGRSVDGILYWNDTQEAPIADTYHPEYGDDEHLANPNPHHAARLWWPIPGEDGYVHMLTDSTKWIGYIPLFEGYSWENDKFYMSGSEYTSKFYGASGHPALSCDPNGNLALAYSAPDVRHTNAANQINGVQVYYRSVFISYKNVDEDYWHVIEDCLTDHVATNNGAHLMSEAIFTISVPNTVNPGEFWFGYQDDTKSGLYWGSNASQTAATDNKIMAAKVLPEAANVSVPETEAQEVVYAIYPNPVTDNVMNVQSASSADATITIVNLVGQTVKQFNQSLNIGVNAIDIDLTSGVYFCTISANGFNKTVKFVVK